MFNKKTMESTPMETVIGPGTRFQGNIRSSGCVRVEGLVEGSVSAEAVLVGEKAQIAGDIVGKSVFIGGKVTGNVTAAQALELHPQGQILGDIRASRLSIAEGALFEGNCVMTADKVGAVNVDELLAQTPA